MAQQDVTRKLTAILYADVAGYSRLTGADEVGTHKRLGAALDLISGEIEGNGGSVVHYAGDAVLADFASVVAAVECAVAIQHRLAEGNAGLPDDKRLHFRIGVNLGEVIVDRDDIYGDGVNVAARLESLAEPGGVCIGGAVHDQVEGRLDLAFEDLGAQEVKNIAKPVRAYRIKLGESSAKAPPPAGGSAAPQQEIRFCTAADGVGIAYATVGQGPPLVKAPNWMNHLEYDWQSPVWRHVFAGLAKDNLLVRHDQRGTGLSDWEVEDVSFEAFVRDLETVVDAAGFERFALLGISQGCSVAIDYAVRHPDRVTHLVFYGGYMRGRLKRGSPTNVEQEEALTTLLRVGWGQDNPAFRQIFTTQFIPDGTPKQIQWFNDLMRMTVSPENAVRLRHTMNEIDVGRLAAEVAVPTLVLHARDDAVVPFEEGRRMAATIPGARFVALEGRNHLILEDEPAWPRFLEEVRGFLGSGGG
ncbi:MAG: alpha/beta fold hydrolase [Rhodospirillales bacterium]|jgi:class 3 adenylate cyclase/pimeloyl-ACP methyl ester carboxylesterase|nr:alpha/beta fold hydrolase [Rhodospirillales bacterium]MDP6774802.1 alpha/beta fold hydrolase [Rhodospirillales bacterium]